MRAYTSIQGPRTEAIAATLIIILMLISRALRSKQMRSEFLDIRCCATEENIHACSVVHKHTPKFGNRFSKAPENGYLKACAGWCVPN